MRGTVWRQCWCRGPDGRKLHGRCPKLGQKGHGKWYARYDAGGEKRRQPVIGPFPAKKEAEEELAAALARIGGGGSAPDRSLRVAAYLDAYLAGKRALRPRTRATDAEAFALYWKPALGAMRLADVRDHHVSDTVSAMELVNRPPSGEKIPQAVTEMLRRMTEARADDERRVLPEGAARHKKSAAPLSPARIARMFAPFRAAMNAAVPRRLAVSPCDGVELPRAARSRPLAWTPAREAAFREALDKRVRAAGRDLTTVERQRLWSARDLRPCPVMVWLPAHAGRFLEVISGERLHVLFCLAAFCGLRRDELLGLAWGDLDLDGRTVTVRETGGGDGPKSDAGFRVVPLPPQAVTPLRAWRKRQAAERLAWGPAWADTGLVFTRPDGSAVSGQWVSVRFGTLAFRAGLPPVRFHDLRHGAASIWKAAGLDGKFISAFLGHSRTSFTDDVYVTLFPDVAMAAMDAAAALVSRSVDARTKPAQDGL